MTSEYAINRYLDMLKFTLLADMNIYKAAFDGFNGGVHSQDTC